TPARARPTPQTARRVHGKYQLTRSGAICFAAIGVIALASLNTGNNLLFMILAVVGAGVVISAITSRVILSGIEIDWAFPQRVFAEDEVRVPITIHNARRHVSAYAISIKAAEHGADAADEDRMKMRGVFAPYLPPQTALHFEAGVTFKRRGIYPSISLEISSRFPFGVLSRKQTVCMEEAILVFPAVEPAAAARRPSSTPGAGMENVHRGAGGDLYSIRPYRDGDPAKHIDWKATAKTGKIRVREFTSEAADSVAIFLDCRIATPLDNAARNRFECAVRFCASLACETLPNRATLQFAGADVRTRAEQGPRAVDAVLAALALIEPDAGSGTRESAPLNMLFAGRIPLVVTDRPADPTFGIAAATGRVVAMNDLCDPAMPLKA
ncbi:MAG: DUF58 domain-containing protein, partial [Alphaproteobacteria bacterium]|nr:DUF58 domain-containing protein [Alphaproteobacteria bacterium]